MKKSINRFFIMPKKIVFDRDLTSDEKMLYATLLDNVVANETSIITNNITDELKESLNRFLKIKAIERWDEYDGTILVKFNLKELLNYESE